MREPLVKRIENAIMSTSHISDLAGTSFVAPRNQQETAVD